MKPVLLKESSGTFVSNTFFFILAICMYLFLKNSGYDTTIFVFLCLCTCLELRAIYFLFHKQMIFLQANQDFTEMTIKYYQGKKCLYEKTSDTFPNVSLMQSKRVWVTYWGPYISSGYQYDLQFDNQILSCNRLPRSQVEALFSILEQFHLKHPLHVTLTEKSSNEADFSKLKDHVYGNKETQLQLLCHEDKIIKDQDKSVRQLILRAIEQIQKDRKIHIASSFEVECEEVQNILVSYDKDKASFTLSRLEL